MKNARATGSFVIALFKSAGGRTIFFLSVRLHFNPHDLSGFGLGAFLNGLAEHHRMASLAVGENGIAEGKSIHLSFDRQPAFDAPDLLDVEGDF